MTERRFLEREDLAPGRRVIFIEQLDRFARPVVHRVTGAGALVIFMRVAPKIRNAAWYRAAEACGHLREFCPDPFPEFLTYWRADDAAFEANELVYAALKNQGRVPLAPVLELFQDKSVEDAFKKNLILRLTEFYRTVAALTLLAQEGLTVEFYASPAWNEVCRWLALADVKTSPIDSVTIRQSSRLAELAFRLSGLKWTLRLMFMPWWVLLGVRRIARAVPVQVPCDLRVYTTDWGFRGADTLEIDWLLDGHRLDRERTCFVIEKPVPLEYRAEFGRRGDRATDVSGNKASHTVSWKFLLNEWFRRGLSAWAKILFVSWRVPAVFVEVAARGWLEYQRWTAFLERWRPRNYVVYNHFHFEHLFRNARLRSVGCTSWYYVNSNQDRGVYAPLDRPIQVISSQFAYIGYDCQIHWGKRDADAYRRIGNSKNYLVCGPLWSEHVRRLPWLNTEVSKRRSAGLTGPVIAVFDTSFGPSHLIGNIGMRVFFESLMSLLDHPAWSRSLLLYKPKNELGALGQELSQEAQQSLVRLRQHPRCLTLREAVRPEFVIAEADLTISVAFTVPTVVALGARRRALYFDPEGRFQGSYYTQFPQLVAQGRGELLRLCEYWLQMPQADFEKYLDKHLAPEFGGHMDTLAATRFRQALSEGSKSADCLENA